MALTRLLPRRPVVAALLTLTAALLTGPAQAAPARTGTGVPRPGSVTHARYGPDAAQTLTVYTPRGATGRRPAVLFVHGGCWVRGTNVDVEEALARKISAETGWVVATMAYRTAGPRWADQPADVAAALRRLQTGPFGVRPDRTALWGESAGGHLSLLTAYRGSRGTRPVVAVASVSGPADLRTAYAAGGPVVANCISAYAQGPLTDSRARGRYTQTSPSSYVTARSAPTYLANAVGDWLIHPDQAVFLSRQLRAAHVPVQVDLPVGVHHATLLETDPYRPGGMVVRQRAEAFLRPYLTAR